MKWRRWIFWPHLVVGLVCGLVVLVMSVTGVLLTYERQLIARPDNAYRSVGSGAPVTAETLLAGVSASLPGETVTSATWQADPQAPVLMATKSRRTIYVDGYSGLIVGERPTQPGRFFAAVRDLHRWLALEGEKRPIGKAVTGWGNVAFLFLVFSGLVLWWPRSLRWPALRAGLVPRWRLPAQAREWNWHNAFGFWCALPLAIVVASGVVISFPWARDALIKLGGTTPPPGATVKADDPPLPKDVAPQNISALLAVARGQVSDWSTITYAFTPRRSAVTKFVIDRGTGGQPQHRSTLVLDSQTGTVARWETFDQTPRGNRWRATARFAHTGEVAGLAGQSIAGLASAGAVVLTFTGFSLSIRRARRAVARRRPRTPEGGDASDTL